MSKGFTWTVSLLVGMVILIFSIASFWNYVTGLNPPQCSDGRDNDGDNLIDLNDPECTDANDNTEVEVVLEKQFCDTDADCQDNPEGEKCLQVYPESVKPFCGCIANSDCNGFICGTNNKCSKQTV